MSSPRPSHAPSSVEGDLQLLQACLITQTTSDAPTNEHRTQHLKDQHPQDHRQAREQQQQYDHQHRHRHHLHGHPQDNGRRRRRGTPASRARSAERPLVSLLVQYFNRPWMLPALAAPFRRCSSLHTPPHLADPTHSTRHTHPGVGAFPGGRGLSGDDGSGNHRTQVGPYQSYNDTLSGADGGFEADHDGNAWADPRFGVEMLINADSREDAAEVAAFAAGPVGSGFVTVVYGNNVHEIRSYNRLARLARGKILVFLQDDDVFPEEGGAACMWLAAVVRAFRRWPRLGAIGSQRYVWDYHPNTTQDGVHFWDPGAGDVRGAPGHSGGLGGGHHGHGGDGAGGGPRTAPGVGGDGGGGGDSGSGASVGDEDGGLAARQVVEASARGSIVQAAREQQQAGRQPRGLAGQRRREQEQEPGQSRPLLPPQRQRRRTQADGAARREDGSCVSGPGVGGSDGGEVSARWLDGTGADAGGGGGRSVLEGSAAGSRAAGAEEADDGGEDTDAGGPGRPGPGEGEEEGPDGRFRFQFVSIVDYAPISVRRSALQQVGGIDEAMSEGGMCGVHSDYDLAMRMWLAGWQVGYLQVPGLAKDPREVEGGTHRPGVSGYCWERQWQLAIEYMRGRWGQHNRWDPEAFYWFGSNVFEVLAEHVRLLNLRLLRPLADPGEGQGQEEAYCPFGYGCGEEPLDRITGQPRPVTPPPGNLTNWPKHRRAPWAA